MVQRSIPATKIGILDYGMGNLRSVFNAFKSINFTPVFVKRAIDFEGLSHLIIPGVGAFPSAMKNIREAKLELEIIKFAESGKPLLGICLGMQLLATIGYEMETCNGLNLIEGVVKKIDSTERIPHVGWNSINLTNEHFLFDGIKKDVDFYFVHSYYFEPSKNENLLATCEYGKKIPVIVFKNNIIGIQFHPEKSQKNGLKILENFANYKAL